MRNPKDVMVDMRPDKSDTKFTVMRWKISGAAVPPSFSDAFERARTSAFPRSPCCDRVAMIAAS